MESHIMKFLPKQNISKSVTQLDRMYIDDKLQKFNKRINNYSGLTKPMKKIQKGEQHGTTFETLDIQCFKSYEIEESSDCVCQIMHSQKNTQSYSTQQQISTNKQKKDNQQSQLEFIVNMRKKDAEVRHKTYQSYWRKQLPK